MFVRQEYEISYTNYNLPYGRSDHAVNIRIKNDDHISEDKKLQVKAETQGWRLPSTESILLRHKPEKKTKTQIYNILNFVEL